MEKQNDNEKQVVFHLKDMHTWFGVVIRPTDLYRDEDGHDVLVVDVYGFEWRADAEKQKPTRTLKGALLYEDSFRNEEAPVHLRECLSGWSNVWRVIQEDRGEYDLSLTSDYYLGLFSEKADAKYWEEEQEKETEGEK